MVEEQPYVGLRPFEASDRAYFFGRDHVLAELTDRIEHSRVVILFGPSGSGKTSLIRAGLVPKLGNSNPAWRIVAVRLFGQPQGLRNLIAQDVISGGQGNLVEILRSPEATQQRALVIVDQLEELFALEPSPEKRRDVVDELVSAGKGCSGNLLFVVRTDFVGTTLEDPHILRMIGSQSMATSLFPLPPLTPYELRDAVRMPAARKGGVAYENDLVEEIIDDLGPRLANLSYLQFVLHRLWDSSRAKGSAVLSRADYFALGGIDRLLEPLRELDSWMKQARLWYVAWERGGRSTELLLSGPLLERGQRLVEGPAEHLFPNELKEYLRQSLDAHDATLLSRQAFQRALKAFQFPGLALRLADAERKFDDASRQLRDLEEQRLQLEEKVNELDRKMEKNKPFVFISYAHEDENVAFRVYNELSEHGLRPWIDKRDIQTGQDWDLEIRRAMKRADFVVVFLSTKSVTKHGYIQKEIRQALDLYKEIPKGQAFLMPIRLDQCEIPDGFDAVQYLNYAEPDAMSKLVSSIISAWGSRRQVAESEGQEANS